jgi:hypothetical protein
VVAARKDQGLPEKVDDPASIGRIAALIRDQLADRGAA